MSKTISFHPNIDFVDEQRKSQSRLETIIRTKKKKEIMANAAPANEKFFNRITLPGQLRNVARVYEHDIVFQISMNRLFDRIGIPNQNLGAAHPLNAVENNLAPRLLSLTVTGFAAIQQDTTASRLLLTLRQISENANYYEEDEVDIRPPAVVSQENSPARSASAGQNRNGRDGDDSGNAAGAAGGGVAG